MTDLDTRLDREKAFHNKRFEEEGRQAQEKYYHAIADGAHKFTAMVNQAAEGRDIVELGCAIGQTLEDVVGFKSALGVDISDEAVRQAQQRSRKNMTFWCGDAHALPIKSNSVDLVFGRGILHHLDTARCLAECQRVLRPGGKVLFWEPLGSNPIFNFYRDRTPEARTVDEHPLLSIDFQLARDYFAAVRVERYGFLTLATTLAPAAMQDTVRGLLRPIDQALFAVPSLDNLAWYCILSCEKEARSSVV